MTFMDLAKMRCSVRKFSPRRVEDEKILSVLEAGRIAPSACNYQPLHFIVVSGEEAKKRVTSTYKEEWLRKAPVIIIVCGDHGSSWKREDGKDHLDIDAAIAADHMTLQAAELGLGTCWVCWFDSRACHEILELPDTYEAIALLPLGYPEGRCDPARHERARKKLAAMMSRDRFDK